MQMEDGLQGECKNQYSHRLGSPTLSEAQNDWANRTPPRRPAWEL